MNKFRIQLDNGTSYGWPDICFKIPTIRHLAQYMPKNERGRRSANDFDDIDDEFDSTYKEKEDRVKGEAKEDKKRPFQPSVHMGTALFCSVVRN